jgi:anti-sigma-K factor RskA
MVIGIGVCIVGIALLTIPGPGIPVLALGAAALARESLTVARILDNLELWARRRFAGAQGRWSRSPGWAKALAVTALVAVAGVAAVGVYEVTLGR